MSSAPHCPHCDEELSVDAPEGLCPQCLLEQAIRSPLPWQPGAQDWQSPPTPANFIPPEPAELTAAFPQLEILMLLGQGGMGAVYKARQVKLQRLVALKVLPPQWGADPAFAERFSREAHALARLNHPNIVAVHDFGEAGGLFFLLMEYVDGLSVRQLLHKGPLAVEQVMQIAPQLCDALQYAHDEGVIHRDIKPENVLIDKRGRVKIADFGLAKLLEKHRVKWSLTGSRQVMGTPHYMAPEQMERPSTVDHRADIYSLGVVIYEMLTGELPLGRFEPPSHQRAGSPRLDAIVMRALAKDPSRRYDRVSDLKADLLALDGNELAGLPLAPVSYAEELDLELCRFKVMGPATGLMITGILGLVAWLVIGLLALMQDTIHHDLAQFLIVISICSPAIVLAAGVVLVSGRRLMRLESYWFVMLGAILAMVPWSPAFPLGFIIGWWALAVLIDSRIKLAFARRAVRARLVPGVSRPAAPVRRRGRLGSFWGSVGSLIFRSRVAPAPAAEPEVPAAPRPVSPVAERPGPLFPLVAEARPGVLPHVVERERPRPARRSRRQRVLIGVLIGSVLFGLGILALRLSVEREQARRNAYHAILEQSGQGRGNPWPGADETHDRLDQWVYPGSLYLGGQQAGRMEVGRYATTDSLDSVWKYYGNKLKLPYTDAPPGAGALHGGGGTHTAVLDDSVAAPGENPFQKDRRAITLRTLVHPFPRGHLTVVISRGKEERFTYIQVCLEHASNGW